MALFNAPVVTSVPDVRSQSSISVTWWLLCLPPFFPQDKKTVSKNIADQAKYARLLIIWTDCDREGEHIGHEIVESARLGNRNIIVKRARFSNIERA